MRFVLCRALLLVSLAALCAPIHAAMPLPQIWTARIVVPEGVEPGLTADQIELRVNVLSTDEEMLGLLEQLRMGGQQGLWNAMRMLQPKGFIRAGKLAATEVTVIRVLDLPNGNRMVRVFCDFPIRLYDKSEPLDARAHPFAFLELEVGPSGRDGTGKLIAAASFALGEAELRIDNAATPPMKVIDVASDKPPAAPPAPPAPH